MRCEEFLRELDESGRAASPEARAHVQGCPSCARAAESWQAVRSELQAMGEEAPPPFLHARVMAHVRADAKSPQREAWWARVPRWAWAGQALAVLLGVTLAGWGLWQGRMSRQPGEALVAVKAAPQVSHDFEKRSLGEEQRRERAMPGAEAPVNEAPAVPPRAASRQSPKGLRGAPPPTAAVVAAAEPVADGGAAGVMGGVPAPASVAPVEADAERARAEGEQAAKDERIYAEELRVTAGSQTVEASRDQAAATGAPASSDTGMPVLGAAKSKICDIKRERPVLACVATRLDAPGRVAFWLTDDLAPGPGEAIVLDVAHDGAVTVAGDRGRDKARADVLAARLRDMRLPPGRYRLTRADP
ncbi:MAG: hypothetical protein HY825_05315 [Acidobacteria bacterium]|nr:hypothetical protein [Acidobacteriota bacterium]